jgi:hypothetical protein
MFAFIALLLPWLGNRWANEALGASPKQAIALARRAHSVDPLLVTPYWARAFAAYQLNQPRQALAWYLAATRRQPKNPQTWLFAGQYAWKPLDCPYLAYDYLLVYTELDQKARYSDGGDVYNAALDRVNHHRYKC